MGSGGEPWRRVERMAGALIDGLLGAASGLLLAAAAPRLGVRPAPPAAGQWRPSALARRAHHRRTVALVIAASGALAALVHVAENGLS